MFKRSGLSKNMTIGLGSLVFLIGLVLMSERKQIVRAGFAPKSYFCLARYEDMNPIIDAEIEAKRVIPRFYYHEFDGVAVGTQGSGLPRGCDPDLLNAPNDPSWRAVNQYESVTGDASPGPSKIMAKCNIAAIDYAERFDRQLAAIRPDRLAHACRNK